MPKFLVPYRMALEGGGTGAAQAQGLTTTSIYTAIVFSAEDTIEIKKAGFLASVAGSSGQTINITIEAITSSTGIPTGTALASTTASTPLTVGWNEVTFATTATLTRGTLYALRVQPANVTGTAVTSLFGYNNCQDTALTYAVNTGTRSSNRIYECFYLVDNAGGAKYYGAPFYAPVSNTIDNTLVEVGVRFKIPTTVCNTFKLLGLLFGGLARSQTPSIRLACYNWSSGNNSTALDTTDNSSFGTANVTGSSTYEMYFDTPQTLNAGSDYIAAIGTSDTSSSTSPVLVRSWTVPDATKPALFDQTANYTWNHVSRTSATGSWTTSADSTPQIQLILDVASLPSGGGLLVHPGMTGGIRG